VAEGEEAEDDDTTSTKKDGLGIAHSSLSVSSQLGTAAAIQYMYFKVSWLAACYVTASRISLQHYKAALAA
jgi:hypothetical protein